MYQIKIDKIADEKVAGRTILILPGQEIVGEDGVLTGELLGGQENLLVSLTDTDKDLTDIRAAKISEKEVEIQAKLDAYTAAIANQLENGGAGPVADFDIMKIHNENNGNFEVVFREE